METFSRKNKEHRTLTKKAILYTENINISDALYKIQNLKTLPFFPVLPLLFRILNALRMNELTEVNKTKSDKGIFGMLL